MTVVVAALGRETLWVAVDRRLSYGPRFPPRDDALKLLSLDALGGKAVFAYAGLGATAFGMEPSTWLRNVLRGRSGGQLQDYLNLVAQKSQEQFPRHLAQMSGGGHVFLVPAFLGKQPAMFSIASAIDSFGNVIHRYQRHVRPDDQISPVPLFITGSGATALERNRASWRRRLFNLVRDEDAGRVGSRAVADHLAGMVLLSHRQTPDGSVGPRSIVIWRRADGSQRDGGGHIFYNGTDLDPSPGTPLGMIPTIANGMDVNAIIEASMPEISPVMEDWLDVEDGAAFEAGPPREIDWRAVDAKVQALDGGPDDRLR